MAFHVACPITWYHLFSHYSLFSFVCLFVCLFSAPRERASSSFYPYLTALLFSLIELVHFFLSFIAAVKFATACWGFVRVVKPRICSSTRFILSSTCCLPPGMMLQFQRELPFRSMCLSSLSPMMIRQRRLLLLPYRFRGKSADTPWCLRRQLSIIQLLTTLRCHSFFSDSYLFVCLFVWLMYNSFITPSLFCFYAFLYADGGQ